MEDGATNGEFEDNHVSHLRERRNSLEKLLLEQKQKQAQRQVGRNVKKAFIGKLLDIMKYGHLEPKLLAQAGYLQHSVIFTFSLREVYVI